jgi:FixJ family two-component response regulator
MGAGYATELLSAIGAATGNEQPAAQTLIEPLSPRELEVLALIEIGHSNQAIAAPIGHLSPRSNAISATSMPNWVLTAGLRPWLAPKSCTF